MTDKRKAEIVANWNRAENSVAAAKTLADAGFYDFVASRAYYAGFYAAAAALWISKTPRPFLRASRTHSKMRDTITASSDSSDSDSYKKSW